MVTDTALHPKRAGSSVEARIVDTEPALEPVSDREADWHDARTTAPLEPRPDRPLDAWCVVTSDTPVEIEAAIPEHRNGVSETVPGRWYIKRQAHAQLVRADAVYYLTVYAPTPDTPLLAAQLTPAAHLDDLLEGRWYECRGRDVARLSWESLIDPGRLSGQRTPAAPVSGGEP